MWQTSSAARTISHAGLKSWPACARPTRDARKILRTPVNSPGRCGNANLLPECCDPALPSSSQVPFPWLGPVVFSRKRVGREHAQTTLYETYCSGLDSSSVPQQPLRSKHGSRAELPGIWHFITARAFRDRWPASSGLTVDYAFLHHNRPASSFLRRGFPSAFSYKKP
jgi:hypothetical protein